ncbi:DUF4190 domain-containing protein [Streptomyces sp. NPDC003042]
MSTPPNPPSSPTGPPTEPAGTPIPEAASGPSLRKTPAPAPAPAPPAAEHNPFAPPSPDASPAPSGFAPLTTAPPARPAPPAGAYGAPGAPANPWGRPSGPGYPGYPGQPGYPGYPGAYPGYPAPTPDTNGMAVAALVLGIVAVPVAFTPLLFWIGTLIGLTGLGLGIAALVRARAGAPRKGMALAGTILGVLSLGASVGGWFLTVAFIDKTKKEIDRSVEDSYWDDEEEPFTLPSPPSYSMPPTTPSEGPGMSTPLAFGQTYTYPNGIKVSMSAPRKYVTANKYMDVGNAVQVTLTITNTTDKRHSVGYAMPRVTDDQGDAGKLVFDGRMPKTVTGVIEPGGSSTGTVAFEVPEGTKSISAEVSPGVLLPAAKFSGPIR